MFICSILLLVCSTAVAQRSDKSILYSRTSISVLLVSLLLVYNSTYLYFLDKGISLFNGLLHDTAITASFHIFIIIITCFILQLTSFYPRKIWLSNHGSLFNQINHKIAIYNSLILNKFSEQYRILEYSLIILFVVAGGTFLISSSDLISIFLSIELQSYGLYILCTTYRNSERATSGGLTYFLLGALSSCFILLGSALLYGNSGNTAFDSIFIINSISNSDITLNNWYLSTYLVFSLIVFSVGFLFKISAAPFHFWSPDVYDAIPTVVTTFVAVFTKITIFVLFLELIHYTCGSPSNFYLTTSLYDNTGGVLSSIDNISTNIYTDNMSEFINDDFLVNNNSILIEWTFIFVISSLLSLIIGSILGLTQFRIKRLYAYSTISHLGFILLALTINSIESIQSFIFYLTQYSLANLNAFFILIAIGYSLFVYTSIPSNKDEITETNKEERNNSPIQLIREIKGYFEINPTLAISLTITLFSFVGIPPLVGFFAKQMVLSAALDNGYIFITFIAILTSVISAYYYLAIVKQIFFYNSDYVINPTLKDVTLRGYIVNNSKEEINKFDINTSNITYTIKNISLSSFLSVTISILTLIMLLFILSPQEWLSLGSVLSLIIFNN